MLDKKTVTETVLPVVLAGAGIVGGLLNRPVVNVLPAPVTKTIPPPAQMEMPEEHEPIMHEHKIVRDAGGDAQEEVIECTLNNRAGY